MDGHDHPELSTIATAVVIDFPANTLHLRVPGLPAGDAGEQEALLDVGANGRLIGLEIGDAYISVMGLPADGDTLARTASVRVNVAPGPEIVLPRRGPGYEITYPSGNECWQMKSVNGTLIQVCATTAGEPPEPPGVRGPSTGSSRRHP